LVGQLPIETKCPDPPDSNCPTGAPPDRLATHRQGAPWTAVWTEPLAGPRPIVTEKAREAETGFPRP